MPVRTQYKAFSTRWKYVYLYFVKANSYIYTIKFLLSFQKTETCVIQSLNELFRSDPRKFSDQFQDFGRNAVEIQENTVQFNTFWSKISGNCHD